MACEGSIMTTLDERPGRASPVGDSSATRLPNLLVRRPGVLVALVDVRARLELSGLLTRQGFNVWVANSGVEAIATYLEHTGEVDLLLLDAELSDLPGPAFLRRFATHFPGVPCFFRAAPSGAIVESLRATGATMVPDTLGPSALSDMLWEAVAFEFLVDA